MSVSKTITIAFRLPKSCEHFLSKDITKTVRNVLEVEIAKNPYSLPHRNQILINHTDPASRPYTLKVNQKQYQWLHRYACNDDRTPGGVLRLLILRAHNTIVRRIYGQHYPTSNIHKYSISQECLMKLINEDCLPTLTTIEDETIDLVVTSPPYAQQRQSTYGGVPEDEYVDWFLPISQELKRVLKPSGSFVLNIKEHTSNGEKALYVFELVIALRKQGWRYVDDYIWHKSNPMPGKWQDRFKDAYEPDCLTNLLSPSHRI